MRPNNQKIIRMQSSNVKLVMQLSNALVKMRSSIAAEFGITSGQFSIMVFLLNNLDRDEINQLDIQNDLLITHQTVTGVLGRLEEKGYIICNQSKRDRRYKRITVTSLALEVKDALAESAKITESHLISSMSENERNEFNRLLLMALKNISQWNAKD